MKIVVPIPPVDGRAERVVFTILIGLNSGFVSLAVTNVATKLLSTVTVQDASVPSSLCVVPISTVYTWVLTEYPFGASNSFK